MEGAEKGGADSSKVRELSGCTGTAMNVQVLLRFYIEVSK